MSTSFHKQDNSIERENKRHVFLSIDKSSLVTSGSHILYFFFVSSLPFKLAASHSLLLSEPRGE